MVRLPIKSFIVILTCLRIIVGNPAQAQEGGFVLSTAPLKKAVDYFNAIDTETVINHVPNAQTFAWLAKNAPLFECPDSIIQQTYYYRWWTFRKHLKETPDGFVFTEFITPVNHAGKHNTVSSGLGHHINEGRWLRDQKYLDQYIDFWLHVDPKTPKPHLRAFSSWLQHAIYERYLDHPTRIRDRNHACGKAGDAVRRWSIPRAHQSRWYQ